MNREKKAVAAKNKSEIVFSSSVFCFFSPQSYLFFPLCYKRDNLYFKRLCARGTSLCRFLNEDALFINEFPFRVRVFFHFFGFFLVSIENCN